jgi:hypothetical protein
MTENNASLENRELLFDIIKNQKELLTFVDTLSVQYNRIKNIEDIVSNGIVTKKYYDEKHKELEDNLLHLEKQHKKDVIKNRWIFVIAIILSNIMTSSIVIYLHEIM